MNYFLLCATFKRNHPYPFSDCLITLDITGFTDYGFTTIVERRFAKHKLAYAALPCKCSINNRLHHRIVKPILQLKIVRRKRQLCEQHNDEFFVRINAEISVVAAAPAEGAG